MTSSLPPRVSPLPLPFDAVLWDFDGTLVDTEPLWLQTELDLLHRWGAPVPDDFPQSLVGSSLPAAARMLLDLAPNPTQTPEEVVEDVVASMVDKLHRVEVPWRPGAEALATSLWERGVPMALVSASYRPLLEAVLDRLQPGLFDTVVAGDEVTRGKPHPEPYLTAAARLGVDPAACWVLEDSATGAAAGNAAGCLVLAVPNVVTPPPAPLRVFVDTLVGLDADALAHLWDTRG